MAPATTTSEQSRDSPSPDATRKATLLCPECDHRSPPAGNWDCRTVGDREIRRCPQCNSVVERRPTFDARDDGRSRAIASLQSTVHSAFVRSFAAFRAAVRTPARALSVAVGHR